MPRLATLAESGCVKIGVRRTPAEGRNCDDLLALAAEEAFPRGMPRNCVAHFWRRLPRVVAFAHDPKFNGQHGRLQERLHPHTIIGIFSASASRAATRVLLSAASLAENSRDCSRQPGQPLCQPCRLPNSGTETILRTCTLVRTPGAGVARRTGLNAQAHLVLTNLPQRHVVQ